MFRPEPSLQGYIDMWSFAMCFQKRSQLILYAAVSDCTYFRLYDLPSTVTILTPNWGICNITLHSIKNGYFVLFCDCIGIISTFNMYYCMDCHLKLFKALKFAMGHLYFLLLYYNISIKALNFTTKKMTVISFWMYFSNLFEFILFLLKH